jgi:hypothetical protein
MNAENAAAPCFFVLGYGRSGTTLFRRMLSAHPQLFVPPENDAFQRLPPVIGTGVKEAAALDRAIAAFPPFYDRVYDVARFRALAAARLPLDPAGFFATLLGTARIGEGKGAGAIWGHKMPSEWPYVGTWRRWYPGARFIHMVRHPHDATASMVEYQLQRYPTTPLIGIWQWRKAFRAIAAHGADLGPGRYLRLCYEDLVADPMPVLAAACRFLGVDAAEVPAMIAYKDDASAAHTDRGQHMKRTSQELTADRIGRAGGDYTPGQTAMLDHVCREEMATLGYTPRGEYSLGPARAAAVDAACAGLDAAWAALRASRRARRQL